MRPAGNKTFVGLTDTDGMVAAVPVICPPVPTPVMTASTPLGKSAKISWAVVRACTSMLAGLLNWHTDTRSVGEADVNTCGKEASGGKHRGSVHYKVKMAGDVGLPVGASLHRDTHHMYRHRHISGVMQAAIHWQALGRGRCKKCQGVGAKGAYMRWGWSARARWPWRWPRSCPSPWASAQKWHLSKDWGSIHMRHIYNTCHKKMRPL